MLPDQVLPPIPDRAISHDDRTRVNLSGTPKALPRISRRAVWWSAFAAFVTSVTIASIPSPDIAAPAAVSINRTLTPPPQTLVVGNTVTYLGAVSTDSGNPVRTTQKAQPAASAWREFLVRPGQSLSQILREQGFSNAAFNRAIQGNIEAKVLYRLSPGDVIRVRADDRGELQELIYRIDDSDALRAVNSESGFSVSRETRQLETRYAYVTGTIQSSLFEDGQRAGLSDALILKLAEIFGWDVDFALDVQAGDSFAVIHEEKYWLGEKIADGQIVAAEFFSRKNGKEPFRAIAHRDSDGFTQFYTPAGMSVRREFLRSPVEFSRISSGFSYRRFHPILKSWTAHKGVDYAASTGTAVRATAKGRVKFVGWKGGYGKCIEIKHGGVYSTLYAHLSRYQPGTHAGGFVEQGQIIGYVGSTGLATGPHLHYEFRVNGVHRNPLTYRFAAAAPIPDAEREAFMHGAVGWNNRLDLVSPAIVALNSAE